MQILKFIVTSLIMSLVFIKENLMKISLKMNKRDLEYYEMFFSRILQNVFLKRNYKNGNK